MWPATENFVNHYQQQPLKLSLQFFNLTMPNQSSTQSHVSMSSKVLQQGDPSMLLDCVYTGTPLRQIGQSVYFLHEQIRLHLNIKQTYGELHQLILSTSILAFFATEFSSQNQATITISTKSGKTIKLWMLFQRNSTPLSKSSCIDQYLFEGMFMCYILHKPTGALQNLLFGGKHKSWRCTWSSIVQ